MEPGWRTIVAAMIVVIISLLFPDIFYSELIKVLVIVIGIVGWLNSIQWFYRLISDEMEADIMRRVEWFERSVVNGGKRIIDLVVFSLRAIKDSMKVIRDTLLTLFRFLFSLCREDTYPPVIHV